MIGVWQGPKKASAMIILSEGYTEVGAVFSGTSSTKTSDHIYNGLKCKSTFFTKELMGTYLVELVCGKQVINKINL